jgi:hypothetical protein
MTGKINNNYPASSNLSEGEGSQVKSPSPREGRGGLNFWLSLSLLNLCIVTVLGVILRSKAIFNLPIIDYNHLLNAHSHFAFGGWVTLALMVLMTHALLTEAGKKKSIYQFVFWSIFVTIWILLLTFPFTGYNTLSTYISTIFIFTTYIFGWIFIKDIRKAKVSKTVLLLAVASVACLVLSSAGSFTLGYLFASKSLNAVLYRDALFSYLHLQYNGFFSLAVFALFFQKIELKLPAEAQKKMHRFAVLLVCSILPSMFLSYHWHDPSILFHIIAYIGSILVLTSFGLFVPVLLSILKVYKSVSPLFKFIGGLSLGAFMLKTFLQSFTIINFVGNLVFGDRPIIMGFLHLVFLGFVTLFLLAYFARTGFLNTEKTFTKVSLVVFALAVVINEVLLWAQGIGAMFIQSSDLFPWMLWGAGIWLCLGATLIFIARLRSAPSFAREMAKEKMQESYSSSIPELRRFL